MIYNRYVNTAFAVLLELIMLQKQYNFLLVTIDLIGEVYLRKVCGSIELLVGFTTSWSSYFIFHSPFTYRA